MSNLDPVEIAKFDAIGNKWWDKSGEFKPLHDINPLRLSYINKCCGSLEGRRVLDIGCGGGILSESMAQQGAIVTAIDLSSKALQAAQEHAKQSGLEIDYRQISAEDMAQQQPASFDVVTCMEMLEHVPDPMSVINACSQLVKPKAHLMLSTINRNPKAWLLAIVGAEYILNLVPRGTHDFKKFIKPSELSQFARNVKLSPQSAMGLHYNPLNQQYWLDENVDVNYMLHCLS